MTPSEIEKKSFEIIEKELGLAGRIIPENIKKVVIRAIHTTADFDFADNLRFSDGAIDKGKAALMDKGIIITDTNMALQGISRPSLKRIGASVCCYMADEDIAKRAKEQNTTRASISMEHAAGLHPEGIYAIGNAPTALLKMADLIEEGLMRPGLIIAVPVGFVNVTESKERIVRVCEAHDIPYIAAMGRKGGSTVAAAICNALLYDL